MVGDFLQNSRWEMYDPKIANSKEGWPMFFAELQNSLEKVCKTFEVQ